MSISIGNYRDVQQHDPNTRVFKCSRGSPVGNPFPMKNESMRDIVCDNYENWFKSQIVANDSGSAGDPHFGGYVLEMVNAAREGDIKLMCWCAPKRCHCETIKEYIENEL